MARTKKDFDKESMFSKIMPTATTVKSEIQDLTVSQTPLPAPSALPITATITNPHMSAITKNDFTSAPRTHNVMEDVVFQKIDEVLERFNCCKCEVCRQDIIAIALNNLPPKYVAATEQKMTTKIQMTMVKAASDANAALVKAAIVVRNNPRHEASEIK